MVYDRAMANDGFARMKDVAADIKGHPGALDVEVEYSALRVSSGRPKP